MMTRSSKIRLNIKKKDRSVDKSLAKEIEGGGVGGNFDNCAPLLTRMEARDLRVLRGLNLFWTGRRDGYIRWIEINAGPLVVRWNAGNHLFSDFLPIKRGLLSEFACEINRKVICNLLEKFCYPI